MMKGIQKVLAHFRSSMGLTKDFSVYFGSEKGRRRQNQDNYLIIRPSENQATAHWLYNGKPISKTISDWPLDRIRLAITDGMGGHKGGREIAQAATEQLKDIPPVYSVKEMHHHIQGLHSRLQNQFSSDDESRPGTTLLIIDLCLNSGKGILANIGDSRAYLCESGEFTQISHDHTMAEFAWRDGELSGQEYEKNLGIKTNEIVQAVGHGSFGLLREDDGYRPNRFDRRIRLDLEEDLKPQMVRHADVKEIQLGRNSSLLLATDGLWSANPKGHWVGPITSCFLSEKEARLQLEKAMSQGSKDNITAVIFGFHPRK